MPVFHEGEPVSQDLVEGFSIPQEKASEFSLRYLSASPQEKAQLLQSLSLPVIKDISQYLASSDSDYRTIYGIDQNLYESDDAYKNRVNELITAQLRSS